MKASEAFDESCPLPASTLSNLAWMNGALDARDEYRDLLVRIVAPYRGMGERSMPTGVAEAIALLDAEDKQEGG